MSKIVEARICVNCKELFTPKPYKILQTFCSRRCFYKSRFVFIKVEDAEHSYKGVNHCKECHKSYARIYYQKNKIRINKKQNEYRKRRIAEDVNTRLRGALRSRIRHALNFQKVIKSQKTQKLLGCTVEELKQHIETLFQEGMTWDNWGRYGWHIDHIIPISKFNLKDPLEQAKACHYTNLQPLWATDNLKKHTS